MRGANPVETPTRFNLTVNLVTAKKLGVTITPRFLQLAAPEDVIRE